MIDEVNEDWLTNYPWVRARFLEQGGRHPDACGRELARFFRLTQLTDEPLAIVSKNIDLLWHTFIQFTESYSSFCQSAYGQMIHHRSRTAFSPVPDEAVRHFFECYEARFGSVPALWLDDAEPELVMFGLGDSDRLPVAIAWSGWPGRSLQGL